MENQFKLHYLYGETVPPILSLDIKYGFGVDVKPGFGGKKPIIEKDNNGNEYIIGSIYPGPGLIFDPHWKVLDMNINDIKTAYPRHYSYFKMNDKSVAIYMPDNDINSASYIYSTLFRTELDRIEQKRLDEGTFRQKQKYEQELKDYKEMEKNKQIKLNEEKDFLKNLQNQLKKLQQNKDRTLRSLKRQHGDQAEEIYNKDNVMILKAITELNSTILIIERNISTIENDLKIIKYNITNLKQYIR